MDFGNHADSIGGVTWGNGRAGSAANELVQPRNSGGLGPSCSSGRPDHAPRIANSFRAFREGDALRVKPIGLQPGRPAPEEDPLVAWKAGAKDAIWVDLDNKIIKIQKKYY